MQTVIKPPTVKVITVTSSTKKTVTGLIDGIPTKVRKAGKFDVNVGDVHALYSPDWYAPVFSKHDGFVLPMPGTVV